MDANDYLVELAAFFLSSARGCMDEPSMYGSFRLIDGLSRLIEIPKYAQCIKKDPVLLELKREIDEKKYSVMVSEKQFVDFVDGLIKKFAIELKRRELEN